MVAVGHESEGGLAVNESRRGEASESEAAMTSGFLREPNLGRQLLGGYSIDETDALLRRAAATVDKLRTTVRTLRQEATESTAAPEPGQLRLAPAGPSQQAGVTEPGAASTQAIFAVGELMVTGHQAIELLRQKAQLEAQEVIEAAHDEASAILAEAAKERTRLEQHQAEAEKVLAQAQGQAATIVANARREREQILADTEQLRSAAEQLRQNWIGQFSQMIEQLSTPAADVENGEAAEIDRDLVDRLRAEPPEQEHAHEQ